MYASTISVYIFKMYKLNLLRILVGILYYRPPATDTCHLHSPFPRCAMAANLVHCGIESGRKQNNGCRGTVKRINQ